MFEVKKLFVKKHLKFAVVCLTILSLSFLLNCSARDSVENWNQTVNKVSSGVVSIQIDVPVAFDGKWNRSDYATGFVVDATRGIILTNRHIVTPGPVTAKAILINNEEMDLAPLYFDPVHDFGFFKYDPQQIKHLAVHEFRLSDAPPAIGEAIRIIGNDAGQKISILDGTISRLDRQAPNYGFGNYNDFNTFYIQAATSSTGGSSGSPVINIKGEAVALNAGSQSKSANAFYLPLEQVRSALEKLQAGEPIERGSLKTTFEYTAYAELKRLGLSESLEANYRKSYPDQKGLLVVRKIIPSGLPDSRLSVGDILLEINDQDAANFDQLEAYLNRHVGKNIRLKVLRQGEELEITQEVADLHKLNPRSLVKFDGGVFHNLSYQQARHLNKPIEGVYSATVGGYFSRAGLPNRSVIVEFNGENIRSVEEFNEQLKKLKNGDKVGLRYFDASTPNTTNFVLVEINRKWFEHAYCFYDKNLSYWPCDKVEFQAEKTVQNAPDDEVQPITSERLEDALVNVSFYGPYSVQGSMGNQRSLGTGIIVNAEKGLIVVARSIVKSILGDVKLAFNNRYEVEGKIEYVHPLHNLALVSYDPSELSSARVAQVDFVDKPMRSGETVLQMGLSYDGVVDYRSTQVHLTEEFWLNQFNVPQFVDKNLDATHFVNPNTLIDGIILNSDNEAVGLWLVFDQSSDNGKKNSQSLAGLSAGYVLDLIHTFENNLPTYSLDIDLTTMAPVAALQRGLDREWVDKIISQRPDNEKLLTIYNVSNSSNSAEFLKRGDIILAINGTPVSRFKQVEDLSQMPEVNVTYFSEGEIHEAKIKTNKLNGVDIDRVLAWSGVFLHTPHRAAQMQGNVSAEGVYISSYTYGSPATRYELFAIQRIVEVDGKTINTPDDFIEAVKDKPHQAPVVVKTMNFKNAVKVTTLRVDNHYWPFYEIKYENGDWIKKDHSNL